MDTFDYVIVGAGAAGCVLANRLSENPAVRILLLEDGPRDRHPYIHVPKAAGKLLANPRYTAMFDVHRGANPVEPTAAWIRGRTLGGSTAINGMMYVRGQPADFEQLALETSSDWGWSKMCEAFKAIEDHFLPSNEWRGAGGPLHLSRYVPSGDPTIYKAAIAAAQSMGIPFQEDLNTPDGGEKIGYVPRTIFRGRRQSAATAFLKPILGRRNLEVRTGVAVERVLFDQTRAVGVEARGVRGAERFTGKRIVLCAGALSSPAILQRSGVGPGRLLESLGIPLVAERADVGENLREHSGFIMQWRAKNTRTNNPEYGGARAAVNALRYLLTHGGPLANAIFEVAGFIKTSPDLDRANAQIMFAPHTMDYYANSASGSPTVEKKPGFMVAMYPLRPRSRGALRITGPGLKDSPRISLDVFADAKDRNEQIELVRFVRNLVSTSPLAQFVASETQPGAEWQTDDQIVSAIEKFGVPGYHAAGTCRMGHDDDAVVDPMTRVREVEGLHVVDLSIAPFVIAGNTFGPVAAMAWRAAELMKGLV